jgi:hypothetical protein
MKKRLKLGILGMFAFVTACANNHSTSHAGPLTVSVGVNFDATTKCPTQVTSNSCGSTAPSDTICASNDDDLIDWVKTDSQQKDFKIVVRQGTKICKTNGSGNTKCKVKKPNQGAFGDADGLAFKYDIEAQNCTKIDPYIIVLK